MAPSGGETKYLSDRPRILQICSHFGLVFLSSCFLDDISFLSAQSDPFSKLATVTIFPRLVVTQATINCVKLQKLPTASLFTILRRRRQKQQCLLIYVRRTYNLSMYYLNCSKNPRCAFRRHSFPNGILLTVLSNKSFILCRVPNVPSPSFDSHYKYMFRHRRG